jgi:iturin family lipopeptide synthetase A
MLTQPRELDIAIIGCSGRFPGARNIDEFWRNVRDGVESIHFFSNEELSAAGVPRKFIDDPAYVRARGTLGDAGFFDAGFFGYHPREAEITDPQQRAFLECAYQALANAGYAPSLYPGMIGVFGGVSDNQYRKRVESQEGPDAATPYQAMLGNSKDYLCTRVSYKLNLRGPSVLVQTACSTSLVAVHVACRSLLAGECDIALAGAVSIILPEVSGYFYQPGSISSPDGHCRPFDESAQGTVGGNGLGIVVLKPLLAAMDDGDCIRAVIRGSAINNDGGGKIGYTAPGIEGQASAIAQAHLCAEVDARDISYVEAHGTGTNLGDPIEIAALARAFQRTTPHEKNYCAIGSVKSNIGHLDAAAGMAGLIKTVLALEHKQLPPSLHFREANHKIDFAGSPFFVNDRLRAWDSPADAPRIAGVSAFGIGGTNAHVVLQEAPPPAPAGESRRWKLLLLSAKSATALDKMSESLAWRLDGPGGTNLADAAYTLALGRDRWQHRKAVVCQDNGEAAAFLRGREAASRVASGTADRPSGSKVFLFPGQGSQYARMGHGLYKEEPVFRDAFDRCARHALKSLGIDLRRVLYGDVPEQAAREQIHQTQFTQPALFAVEYALTRLWSEWGVDPDIMLGHSVGEYVAACLAGVFSLEDAIELVALRARLVQGLPPGAMAVAAMKEEETRKSIGPGLSLAAVNSSHQCTVAGPVKEVDAWLEWCASRRIACKKIPTSHAFHSAMVEPVMDEFRKEVQRRRRMPPRMAYISGQTGQFISEEEATSAEYWVRHLREPVRFGDGVQTLLAEMPQVFIEAGPGQNLATLVRRAAGGGQKQPVAVSCLHPSERQELDAANLLYCAGRLWTEGVELMWEKVYHGEKRRRVPLPGYPFEPQLYWIESQDGAHKPDGDSLMECALSDFAHVPVWRPAPPLNRQLPAESRLWLVFVDEQGFAFDLAAALGGAESDEIVLVEMGERWEKAGRGRYRLNPEAAGDYRRLLAEIGPEIKKPIHVAHLWNVTANDSFSEETPGGNGEEIYGRSFRPVLFLAQAMSDRWQNRACSIHIIGNGLYDICGHGRLQPLKAPVLGICKAIPHEYPQWNCRVIDIAVPEDAECRKALAGELARELRMSSPAESVAAYRRLQRWVRTFEPYKLDEAPSPPDRLRVEGVYLITGGTGGLGLALAEFLASTLQARLVLVARTPFPPRSQWPEWLRVSEADSTRKKIERIMAMESAGARILVAQADVADLAGMQAVFSQAERFFGPVHGIIHAAGIPGENLIATTTPAVADSVFRAKIQGTMVLAGLAEQHGVDFLLLCSSVTALWGGIAASAYAGANSFQDAFSHWRARNPKLRSRVISVNWARWHGTGMASTFKAASAMGQGRSSAEAASGSTVEKPRNAITAAEGQELFKRLVAWTTVPQLIISPESARTRASDALVRGAAAKLPEKDLAAAVHARPALAAAFAEAQDEKQAAIARIWRQLLGFDRIGIHDNFYELGGDSLLAIQVVARIQEALAVDLSLDQFFRDPTVAGIAAGAGAPGEIAVQNMEIKPIQHPGPLPLSFQEEMFWKLAEIDSRHLACNLFTGLRLTGNLAADALQKAFQELLRRHDVLRTGFVAADGGPRRVVHSHIPFTLELESLEHLPAKERYSEGRRMAGEYCNAPFELARAPLFRARLFRLGDQEHILALACHHIISDAWSLAILLNELKMLYGKLAGNGAHELPALPFRYADYAAWQRNFLSGERLQELENYWRKQLAGLVSQMQFSRVQDGCAREIQGPPSFEFFLDAHETESIRRFSRGEGVTLFATLLSAFILWIHQQTGAMDVPVGIPVANRGHGGLEQMLGIFVNILVLRADVSGQPEFRQLAHRVQHLTEQGYIHQEMPLKRLYEMLRPEPSRHLGRLFQVEFNFIKTPPCEADFAGLTVEDLELAGEHEPGDTLHLYVRDQGSAINFYVVYKRGTFSSAEIEEFPRSYKRILGPALAGPEAQAQGVLVEAGGRAR